MGLDLSIRKVEKVNGMSFKELLTTVKSQEVKYYGKNWDLFGLLDHELCGEVFDNDTYLPIHSLDRKILTEVFNLTRKNNPEIKDCLTYSRS